MNAEDTTVEGTTNPPRLIKADVAPSRLAAWRRVGLGRQAGVIIGLVAVLAYLTLTSPDFLAWGNIMNIFRAQSVTFILAIGMSFVILSGGLDLSVASASGAALMILGISIQAGWGWPAAVATAILFGAGLGLVNGVLIGYARISFFVVTLGTFSMFSSLALVLTSGSTISLFTYETFKPVADMANGSIGPFPTILLIVAALYLVAFLVLHFTSFGRAVYAVGSNPEAARLTGVNVRLTTMLVYSIAGLTAGIGAVQQAGRLTAASPIIDPNLMLGVIAAVLIGGMSLRGGEGGLLGTILGVLFLGLIQNGLVLSGVSAFWQGMVTGTILISAVGLAVLRDTGLTRRVRQRVRSTLRRSEPA